jgi:hypothetical protein
MSGVVDAEVVRGAGGVVGAPWGATEVLGATRGRAKVGKAGDEGAAKGLAV